MSNSDPGFELVLEAVAVRYGVALPPDRVQVFRGSSGAVFRAGEFVVRVDPADIESVRWEHALLRFLAEEIDQVVEPLVALDGSTLFVEGGRIVSVFRFLPGKELRSQEPLFRDELPRLLARVHRRAQAWPVADQRPGVPSLRERDWERNDWWDWEIVEKSPPLVRAFEELREWVATAELCVCSIHGDFHTGNVLVRDGSITGIIDWQYARRDWPALELAGMVWDLCSDGTSAPHLGLCDEVIGQYVDAGGPGEPEALRPLMRLESLVSALIGLTREARRQACNREFTEFLIATLDELA